jgi:hypothetical protein
MLRSSMRIEFMMSSIGVTAFDTTALGKGLGVTGSSLGTGKAAGEGKGKGKGAAAGKGKGAAKGDLMSCTSIFQVSEISFL